MLPSLLVLASGGCLWERPRIFSIGQSGSINISIAMCYASDKINLFHPSDGAAGAAGAAGASGAGSDDAAAGAAVAAPAPFFFPIASITRAKYEPGSLSNRTNCVAGALRRPSNWLKTTSRDGNVASA